MRFLAVLICFSILFLAPSFVLAQQQMFERVFMISPPSPAPPNDWGWGNAVAGVDFDGDGLLEIYAVNNNMYDGAGEMIPRIFKYELNSAGDAWNIVWSDTLVDIPAQNTWPALTYGDWDEDGKMEIIWGPVNWVSATNPRPDRIIVYEEKGDGSDVMGVDDGADGDFRPNARWSIDTTAQYELRPFRWELHDIDGDGALELIFCDRASSSAGVGYKFAVVSVSDIPDNGDGSETWTLEASGKGLPTAPNTVYDMAVLDSTAYFFHATTAGYVSRIRWRNGEYVVDSQSVAPTPLSGSTVSGGWKNVQMVDIDGDGTKEMIGAGYGGNSTNRIWIVEVSGGGDNLVGTELFNPTPLVGSVRLLGSVAGDIDNDGNLDIVFGTRGPSTPVGALLRVEYKGSGAVTDPANYDFSVMESGYGVSDVRYDFFSLFNLDLDPDLELLYGAGYGGDLNTPMIILDKLPGEYTNATFVCNTATVPDTIPVAGANIQIRGGTVFGVSPITWGNDAQNNMARIGGDYWKTTLSLRVGDTLRYKYVIGYAAGTGWEQNLTPADAGLTGGDRSFIVPNQDSTLKVEFWNNDVNGAPQYFRPWTAVDDTIMNVYFRVNMAGPISTGAFSFNNDVDTVAVRGGGTPGSDLDWGTSAYLTRESPATNGDGYTVPANQFWSGRLKFPKSGLTEGQEVFYKFMIGYDWLNRDELQGQPNRSFKVPVGLKDTTLGWVFYNNDRPMARPNPDTCYITFRTNLAGAIQTGGFALGDTLYVRSGYFGTATEAGRRKEMTREGLGTVYRVTDTVVTSIGQVLDYQYYTQQGGIEVRENYYNFGYTGAINSEAERRQFDVPGNTFTIQDTATSVVQPRRQPVFPNARALARSVKVTWECDVRPAYYQVMSGDTLFDIQGTFNVTPGDKDSIFVWGVWMNGPAVGGWGNPGTTDWGLGLQGNLDKKLYDDGTNGDRIAGDSVYSRIVIADPDSIGIGSKWQVGQIYKFGIRGGDNEGGRGGFGNNHSANIDDADTVYTIYTQFGSINPAYYDAWDFDNRVPVTSVQELEGIPVVYSLEQNYPNPFNPSTKIEYSVPQQTFVTLKVYNIIGQEVATLVNEVQKAGRYVARLDAAQFATGVYFYRLTAENFSATKKMLLLK